MVQYVIKRLNNVQFHMTQDTKHHILNNLNRLKYMGFNYLEPITFNTSTIVKENLPATLNSLHDIVSNCNLCSLSSNRKNILFGSGNKNADILFLGEAPTSVEDEKGNLLFGNSGDMIIKMCQNVLGKSIDDIYVVNILKCLPNKDIEDLKLEINTCLPYIRKQIDIIRPKIIVAFGHAYEYLIDDKKVMDELRGNVQYYNNTKVIVTFDPSFILRNPSLKIEVLKDLEKVKNLMESL